ncbi:MAG: hypothetical protein K6A81_06475 [Clostridiales bacterium]|nr:hypothetical protein [Clostridiales bacterium]
MKMIKNNRSRFFLTIIGFVVSVMVLLLGLYYWRISKNVIEDNINEAFSKRLVLVDEVNIPLVNYYLVGEDLIPTYNEISNSELLSIISEKGVSSVSLKYLAPDVFTISCDGIRVRLPETYAVNTGFESFSKAREDALKKDDPDFKVMSAGRGLSGEDPYEVMVNEAFSTAMGWTSEEACGKKLVLSVPGTEDIELKVVGVYSHKMSSWLGTNIDDLYGWFAYDPMSEENEIGDAVLFDEALFEILSEKTGKEEYKKPSDIIMSMEDTSYIEDMLKDLAKEHSLNAQSDYMEFADQLKKQTEFTWVFILVGAVLSLLVLIMVSNSICINIYRQRRFSNLLALLGYSRQRILRLYAAQSLIYGFIGSLIGAAAAYLITTFIGMKAYSSLEEYGFSSSKLLLPVHYALLAVCLLTFLSCVMGYLAAAVKVKRR